MRFVSNLFPLILTRFNSQRLIFLCSIVLSYYCFSVTVAYASPLPVEQDAPKVFELAEVSPHNTLVGIGNEVIDVVQANPGKALAVAAFVGAVAGAALTGGAGSVGAAASEFSAAVGPAISAIVSGVIVNVVTPPVKEGIDDLSNAVCAGCARLAESVIDHVHVAAHNSSIPITPTDNDQMIAGICDQSLTNNVASTVLPFLIGAKALFAVLGIFSLGFYGKIVFTSTGLHTIWISLSYAVVLGFTRLNKIRIIGFIKKSVYYSPARLLLIKLYTWAEPYVYNLITAAFLIGLTYRPDAPLWVYPLIFGFLYYVASHHVSLATILFELEDVRKQHASASLAKG